MVKLSKPPKNFINPETPKKKEERAIVNGAPELGKLMQWKEFAMNAAQRRHWEWFVIDQFIRGNHDIKGNSADNSLEIKRSRGAINYPINVTYAVFRAVRGFVTRHQ